MNYWYMSLHPVHDKNWNKTLEILEKVKVIGLGNKIDENNVQIQQFKKMDIGDIVLIKNRQQYPLSLVKVVGEIEENDNINEDLNWFVFQRKIEVLSSSLNQTLDFKIPPSRFSKSKNPDTKLFQFIDETYKNITSEEDINIVNINDYSENFSLDIPALKQEMGDKIDDEDNIFFSDLKEFYINNLSEINKVSVQIKNVKSINSLSEGFTINFDNKIYSIVGNNGIGKSALLVSLGQLVNQTYFSYEFKGNAYDDSIITFVFNDIIKFEWKKFSSKTNKKVWSVQTKNSLGDMPRINGFFESGIISGTRFENLGIKKQVLNVVERNGTLYNEDTNSNKINFIKENLNYIINDSPDSNKYDTLFTAQVNIPMKRNIKKETKFFFKNSDSKVVSEYSFCTGEYFILSLLKLIFQYINSNKKSLVVIDEIDISLHPLAQRRLLHKIKEFATSYKITFVIATHSLQIIENLDSSDIYYFENDNGIIKISNPIYPAYVTRNIYEHKFYDKVLLVEDTMASQFLEKVIKRIDPESSLRTRLHYKIIEIGDWRKVLEVARDNERDKYYPNAEVLPILDNDVSKKDANNKDQANARKWNSIFKQFIPVEDNIEKYTVKNLLTNNDFKAMIQTELMSTHNFDELDIQDEESNTEQIKDKFSKGNRSLVKQISDKSVKNEKEIISKIIEFIFEKKVSDSCPKYISFEDKIKEFLDIKGV